MVRGLGQGLLGARCGRSCSRRPPGRRPPRTRGRPRPRRARSPSREPEPAARARRAARRARALASRAGRARARRRAAARAGGVGVEAEGRGERLRHAAPRARGSRRSGIHSRMRCTRLPKSRPPARRRATTAAAAPSAPRPRVAEIGHERADGAAPRCSCRALARPSARPPRRRPPAPASARRSTPPSRASARGQRVGVHDRARRRPGCGGQLRDQVAARRRPTRASAGGTRDHEQVARARAGHVQQPPRLRPGASPPRARPARPSPAAGSRARKPTAIVPSSQSGDRRRRPCGSRRRCRRAPRSAPPGPWPCGWRGCARCRDRRAAWRAGRAPRARLRCAPASSAREAAQGEHAELAAWRARAATFSRFATCGLAAAGAGERGQDARLVVEPLEQRGHARRACAARCSSPQSASAGRQRAAARAAPRPSPAPIQQRAAATARRRRCRGRSRRRTTSAARPPARRGRTGRRSRAARPATSCTSWRSKKDLPPSTVKRRPAASSASSRWRTWVSRRRQDHHVAGAARPRLAASRVAHLVAPAARPAAMQRGQRRAPPRAAGPRPRA